MTKQRKLIYEIILASKKHLTAEEVYQMAQEQMPSIALGTVYRNLGLMVDDGDIQRITLAGQPDHFDRIVPQHDHIVCIRCGKIQDVVFDELQSYFEEKTRREIYAYELNLTSICDECKKKETKLKK